MIVSEKSHQNLSDYNQFLIKKKFEDNEKIDFIERNSGNCIYLIQCAINKVCMYSTANEIREQNS